MSGFVTVTVTGPTLIVPGAVAEIADGDTTFTDGDKVVPTRTDAPAWKFAPMIVTCVPPFVEPNAGETAVTVGAGTGARYVNALFSTPLCPSAFVTRTAAGPAV